MMAEMTAMASAMTMEAPTSQHNQMNDSHRDVDQLSMTDHCSSQASAKASCGEHQDCGACLAHCSGALISELSSFNTNHRFSFEADYRLWLAPRTYSRLLRPPKLA